jgi:DnaJ-class molecular chaperone
MGIRYVAYNITNIFLKLKLQEDIMAKDYYKILDLPRTCESADIRAAYLTLANQWHPDKCSDADAESKFHNILEAYTTLNDPKKRSLYDASLPRLTKTLPTVAPTQHTQVYHQVNGVNGFPPEAQKLFERYFGTSGAFGTGGGFGATTTAPSASSPFTCTTSRVSMNVRQSVVKTLQCSLEDIYVGAVKLVKITRNVNGSVEDKLLRVEISKGCPENREIVHERAGDKISEHLTQDIVFVVNSSPHSVFTRVGDDLHMKHTVSLREYINGFTVQVPSLDRSSPRQVSYKYGGQTLTDKLPECKIADMGMPICGTDRYGSLVIHVSVKLPIKIDSS